MESYDITTVTSRGQVTIPQNVREKERIKEGDKILVRDVDGYIVMKKISQDMLQEFFKTMKEVGKHVSMHEIRQMRKGSEKTFARKTKK
jgi:AbrB family looped-hinge helix DNA binding protein